MALHRFDKIARGSQRSDSLSRENFVVRYAILLTFMGVTRVMYGYQSTTDHTVSGRELLIGGLRDTKQYWVVTSYAGPQGMGLSAASLAEQIKLRLRQAGVGVGKESPIRGTVLFPQLVVDLEMLGPGSGGRYPMSFHLRVDATVASIKRSTSPFFVAAVYQDKRLLQGQAETLANNVRSVIDELLDAFLNAHLEMNPR